MHSRGVLIFLNLRKIIVSARFSHFNIAIAYSNFTFCGAWDVLVFLKFGQFSSELTKTWSSGATECRVWIGNCNVKVWKSTEHKLHKIWRSLKFCVNSGKRAHPWQNSKFLWVHRKTVQISAKRAQPSRMRTICCSGCRGRGRLSAQGSVWPSACWDTPQPWTEFSTHACENITFPQLRSGR